MSVLNAVDNNNLLTYAVTPDPDPIQVSPPEGNPSYTALTVVVSNSTTDAIYCNRITFGFTIGPLAQNLTDTADGILVSASPSDKWQIAVTAAGQFTATPTQPGNNVITTDGLVFQIYNIKVNDQVGTFTLTVQENSSTDNTNFSNHTNKYDIAKFPYGFFVDNFTADRPQVEDGGTATLTWVGSDLASYTILYAGESVNVTDTRRWVSPPLHTATTFILKASVQSQGQTVDTFLNTTVQVENPELKATKLTVTGASALEGDTTIGTGSSNAALTVNGGQTVTGNATLGGTLGVSGNTTVGGTLGVTGTTTLKTTNTGNITTTGNSNVSGNTTTGSLAVTGSSNLKSVNATSIYGTYAGISGRVNINGPADNNALYITGHDDDHPPLYIVAPSTNGINVRNTSARYPTIYARNYEKHSDNKITGIISRVESSKDWGFGTNGKITTDAVFSQIQTKRGYKVFTSPLCPEMEIQFSGTAQMEQGSCLVALDEDISDVIAQTISYRVLITPLEDCNGVFVINKTVKGFTAKERGAGKSSAAFDWLIIARKVKELGSVESAVMPEKLPEIPALDVIDPDD